MQDTDLDRKIAKDWREYLKEMKTEKEMFKWVWDDLINPLGKSLAKKVFWAVLISYIFRIAKPWTISLIFDGVNEKSSLSLAIWGLTLCGITIIITELVNRKGLIYRELLFGENWRQLDQKTTKLFFEKSLGTHIDENNLLNEANIKKGYERVFQLEAMMIWEGVECVMGLFLPFCALWFLDWKVAIAVTFMLVLHFSWSVFLNQKTMEYGIPVDKKWREMNRFRTERLDQIERVKNNSKEKDELKELGRKFENVIKEDRKLWLWIMDQVIKRGLIDHLLLIVIMIYGVYMVWYGEMSVGLLYPLFSWTNQLADNLWRAGHFEREVNFLTPSILSMKEALTMPTGLKVSENPKILPKNSKCRIEFANVSYVYPGQENTDGEKVSPVSVLKGASFKVKAGEKVALIGSTGAGKTTIMRLLLRYMDPTSGYITVDGKDLKDLDLNSWRQLVGYIPQESQILNGTIRYNLLYGLPNEEKKLVTNEMLWEIMETLKINFEDRLTHGLNTQVGRNGIQLSGGQAQRVMIGAAVVKNPRFMIIDEATSSLDAATERMVQEGLEKALTEDQGALIITHRLNTVRRICDKFVMVSKNGEKGGSRITAIAPTFEDLAKKSSEFRSLAEDQGIVL